MMQNGDYIVAVDLDETLCYRPSGFAGITKYLHCKPKQSNIDKVNALFDKGYTIKIYTARGMTVYSGDVSKIYSNLYELTKRDLDKWGIKYHQLVMGKLGFHILIDDRVMNEKDMDVDKVEEFVRNVR